jgi:hypothetical protein
LQIWRGKFGYCSYSFYPSFDSRYVSSDTVHFPSGCDGLAYIPTDTSIQYDSSITNSSDYSWTSIYWENPIDTFDNFYASYQSIFRVTMINEWAPIAFSASSCVGENIQPQYNNSRISFAFFLFVSVFALFLNTVFAALIFYHYLAIFLAEQQKHSYKREDIIWLEMMVCSIMYIIHNCNDAHTCVA